MNLPSTPLPSATAALNLGDLVVVSDDSRGLARLDRFLDDNRARVFFFADGSFAVVDRVDVKAAPVGTGAPAHDD